MARIRSIKPEFWTSEQVTECSPMARLLFIGLWNFCDDHGIHPDSAKRIKMEVFPGDEIAVADVQGWVDDLVEHGLVERYEAEGEKYLRVTGWSRHQKIDKPSYKYPQPVSDKSAKPRRKEAERHPPDRSRVESNGEETVANATGADAPGGSPPLPGFAGDPEPVDLKKQIFGPCLQWLARETGKPADSLRSLVGRWIKTAGSEGPVIEAIAAAQRDRVLAPIDWITAAVNSRSASSGHFSPALAGIAAAGEAA